MLKRIIVGAAVAAGGWAAFVATRHWYDTWGVDPDEAERALPGDELVEAATAHDTRGITIEATPEAVWPWLVQMGYGRAGWYSYDMLDMKGSSATTIVPELQTTKVGDIMPTDPSGGFVVKVLDPRRALVLYVDTEMVAAREKADLSEESPGLAMSGRFLETATPPEFKASWAFVLEPIGEGKTRLIERFRAAFEEGTPASRALAPILGFGVFVMTQRQMEAIRDRAEMLSLERALSEPEPASVVENAESSEPEPVPVG